MFEDKQGLIYAKFDILGSDDKDICGERKAKIIGASIDASEQCQLRGHTLVAAPAQKRLCLGLHCRFASFLIPPMLCTCAFWGVGHRF